MCNHRYRLTADKVCPLPALYRWIQTQDRAALPEPFAAVELPMDGHGTCLFHSKERDFKQSLTANKRFRELVKLHQWSQGAGYKEMEVLDCEGFLFVGEETFHPELESADVVDLSELVFPQPVSLKDTTFEDPAWFNYCKFVGSASFEQAVFHDDAHFENAVFERRVLFGRALFVKQSGFRETEFKSGAEFVACHFTEAAAFYETLFHSHASFNRATFTGNTFFQKVVFMIDVNEGLVTFLGTIFDGPLRMEDTQFHGEVTFKDAKFTSAEFIDVEFSTRRKVILDGITVRDKLVFKSLDAKRKLFRHVVSFDVKDDDIAGRIVFEHANVFFLQQQDAVKRLAAPGIAKIVFGIGCDRYKLRVEREVPMEPQWMFLVEEMAETFVIFFELQGLVPVKINAECEYGTDRMTIRYFADCDLSQEKFERLLQDKVPAFVELLKDPETLLHPGTLASAQAKLIETFDAYRKIKALQLGLAPRIKMDPDWTPEQTAALLSAVGSKRRRQTAIEIHQHFTQLGLLSFGSKQYAVGGDLTIGGVGDEDA